MVYERIILSYLNEERYCHWIW